jgi:hypothetical protein
MTASQGFSVIYVLLGIGAVFGLWGLIAPRSAWRALVAWQYRNPEAHEPSEAAYTVSRVSSFFALVMMVITASLISSAADSIDTEPDPQAEYEECLERERAQDDGQGGLTPEDWCDHLLPEGEQLD